MPPFHASETKPPQKKSAQQLAEERELGAALSLLDLAIRLGNQEAKQQNVALALVEPMIAMKKKRPRLDVVPDSFDAPVPPKRMRMPHPGDQLPVEHVVSRLVLQSS